MKQFLLPTLVFFACHSASALEKHDKAPIEGHETFDTYKPEIFTQFPEKNSEVLDSVLWTRGESGGKYPPTVAFPVQVTDGTFSFRFRHLGDGNMFWLFINGDDGYGGFDHVLRVKVTRKAISLQVDAHTMDPKGPNVQPGRKPDPKSGAYRAPEQLKPEMVEGLDDDGWHELELSFEDDTVEISLDGRNWKTELSSPGFAFEKQEFFLFLSGGEAGIEIDDLKITPKL
ncbi:MAG: hypothetical protein P1U54_14900 [Immundisolibacteraceae bacterium]|nr:hypothetical protein [Immundisolibacteraceae bacterium]